MTTTYKGLTITITKASYNTYDWKIKKPDGSLINHPDKTGVGISEENIMIIVKGAIDDYLD